MTHLLLRSQNPAGEGVGRRQTTTPPQPVLNAMSPRVNHNPLPHNLSLGKNVVLCTGSRVERLRPDTDITPRDVWAKPFWLGVVMSKNSLPRQANPWFTNHDDNPPPTIVIKIRLNNSQYSTVQYNTSLAVGRCYIGSASLAFPPFHRGCFGFFVFLISKQFASKQVP